jgi:alkaline phosphatase D
MLPGLGVATLLLVAVGFFVLRFGVAAVPLGPRIAAALSEKVGSSDQDPADGPAAEATPEPGVLITHGVASGEVTATSAVLWARMRGQGDVFLSLYSDPRSFASPLQTITQTVWGDHDYAAAVRFDGLDPDTRYIYAVRGRLVIRNGAMFQEGLESFGQFRTAPDPLTHRNFSFIFSGDVAGSGYCRSPERGYPIFEAMTRLQPDLFIANGDMIYADNTCPATNPDGQPNLPGAFRSVSNRAVDWTSYQQVFDVYLQHWRYNRADLPFQRFLAETPMFVVWDDHEIINDSGASGSYWNATSANRPGFPTLASAARDAFFAYAPLIRDPAEPNRIYRHFSWGADADFFLLDTRSYRSRNDLADTPENQKTMLGAEQLAWLTDGLARSTATWKIVVTSVPLSIPTGGLGAAIIGRDAWANGTSWDYSSQTGFERELFGLLHTLDDRGVRNVVFLSGDAHQAVEFRYETDLNGDGRPLVFHEIVAGPLSAPATRDDPQLDPSLNPTLLFREAGLYNFGYVRIQLAADGLAHVVADIRDSYGQPRPGSRLDLTPER